MRGEHGLGGAPEEAQQILEQVQEQATEETVLEEKKNPLVVDLDKVPAFQRGRGEETFPGEGLRWVGETLALGDVYMGTITGDKYPAGGKLEQLPGETQAFTPTGNEQEVHKALIDHVQAWLDRVKEEGGIGWEGEKIMLGDVVIGEVSWNNRYRGTMVQLPGESQPYAPAADNAQEVKQALTNHITAWFKKAGIHDMPVRI